MCVEQACDEIGRVLREGFIAGEEIPQIHSSRLPVSPAHTQFNLEPGMEKHGILRKELVW
jgi:hypothetical protein